MSRRFALIVLMLCLPLRLWAGMGAMMEMTQPVEQAVQAHSAMLPDHPCHESGQAGPAVGLAQSDCDERDCSACAVCHMPLLQSHTPSLGLEPAPRAWVLHAVARPGAVDPVGLFKPPVS